MDVRQTIAKDVHFTHKVSIFDKASRQDLSKPMYYNPKPYFKQIISTYTLKQERIQLVS